MHKSIELLNCEVVKRWSKHRILLCFDVCHPWLPPGKVLDHLANLLEQDDQSNHGWCNFLDYGDPCSAMLMKGCGGRQLPGICGFAAKSENNEFEIRETVSFLCGCALFSLRDTRKPVRFLISSELSSIVLAVSVVENHLRNKSPSLVPHWHRLCVGTTDPELIVPDDDWCEEEPQMMRSSLLEAQKYGWSKRSSDTSLDLKAIMPTKELKSSKPSLFVHHRSISHRLY